MIYYITSCIIFKNAATRSRSCTTFMKCILYLTITESQSLLSFQYRRTITERSFIYQIVGNATFSVDTFFFISGMLVVVLFFRSAKKISNCSSEHIISKTEYIAKTSYQMLISILYRYLRLTPAYLFVIVFNEIALK